jgi:hypothetical protein
MTKTAAGLPLRVTTISFPLRHPETSSGKRVLTSDMGK